MFDIRSSIRQSTIRFENVTNANGINFDFCLSPSFSNIENCSRNLDMQELDYNPSKKDLTDAKIHHLLAEELKPYKRVSITFYLTLEFLCSTKSNNASYRLSRWKL